MPNNHHFWKQIQSQQKRRPSLSETYSTLLENQNVALYSKDIGDAVQAPASPEGTQLLGVVPQDYVGKIKSLASLQGDDKKNILTDLFKDKANISTKYHKDLVPVIKQAVESSGYEHAADLFVMAPYLNGFFDILGKESYNVIQATLEGVQQYSKELVGPGLSEFLYSILPDTTKYASTNVGPGELFFVLFSNAKVSTDGGKKSGDLDAGGVSIELKASGARMNSGPSRQANHASINISKFLKSKNNTYAETGFFEREKNELADKMGDLVNQSPSIEDFLNKAKQLLETEEAHPFIVKKFNTGLFKPLKNNILDSVLGSTTTQDVSWATLVEPGSGKISKRSSGRPVTFFVLNRLQDIKNSPVGREASLDITPNKVTNLPKMESNLTYLLTNTFNILKKMDINSISKEDIINIISLTNSYTEKECSGFGYSIIDDLTGLFSDKTPEQILNTGSGALANLIGAMHLVSYCQEKKFDRLMFLNKVNGDVVIFQSPMSLKEGLNICKRPDITVDTAVDPAGGTIIGTTCKYFFKTS